MSIHPGGSGLLTRWKNMIYLTRKLPLWLVYSQTNCSSDTLHPSSYIPIKVGSSSQSYCSKFVNYWESLKRGQHLTILNSSASSRDSTELCSTCLLVRQNSTLLNAKTTSDLCVYRTTLVSTELQDIRHFICNSVAKLEC